MQGNVNISYHRNNPKPKIKKKAQSCSPIQVNKEKDVSWNSLETRPKRSKMIDYIMKEFAFLLNKVPTYKTQILILAII